jgi:Holliday junction resolvasome RuvABC endonuclease subunit
MRIIAFDQAKKTGYAVFEDEELIKYGVLDCSQYRDVAERNHNIKNLILSIIKRYNGEVFAIEDVQYEPMKGGVKSFKPLARLLGALEEMMFENQFAYIVVSPGTWRKACGIGGNKREDQKANAIAWVKANFNIDVTEDEADAICIGWYLVQRMDKK